MTQTIHFGRDEKKALTWVILGQGGIRLNEPNIYDDGEFDFTNKELSKSNLSIYKELRITPYAGDFPYNIKISFDNEADEAEFILKASGGIVIESYYVP